MEKNCVLKIQKRLRSPDSRPLGLFTYFRKTISLTTNPKQEFSRRVTCHTIEALSCFLRRSIWRGFKVVGAMNLVLSAFDRCRRHAMQEIHSECRFHAFSSIIVRFLPVPRSSQLAAYSFFFLSASFPLFTEEDSP